MTDYDRIVEDFLAYITPLKKLRASCTFATGMFKQYLEETSLDFLCIKVKQAQDFQGYLMSKTDEEGSIKYSKYTITGALTGMREFYKYLKKENLVYSNPFMLVKRIKTAKELPKGLPDEEAMHSLLSDLSCFWKEKTIFKKRQLYRSHVIMELLYSTGMTITELQGIKTEDIDFTKNIVYVSSTYHTRRECLLNEYTASILKIYVEKVRPVFFYGSNYKAGQADLSLLFGSKTELRKTVNRIVGGVCAKLGINRVLLKHVRFVTGYHLIRAGCDIRFIQEILGQKCLANSKKFLQMENKDLKSALDTYHPRRASS